MAWCLVKHRENFTFTLLTTLLSKPLPCHGVICESSGGVPNCQQYSYHCHGDSYHGGPEIMTCTCDTAKCHVTCNSVLLGL